MPATCGPTWPDTVAALQRQRGEYTLETVAPSGERHYERIRSIQQHRCPYEPSLAGLIDVGADAATRIISFTVTEAGYYLDSNNRLDPSYAELASDIAGTTRSTIYGALAAILNERRKRGSGPVTLLNCDNLRSNGERFRAGFVDFLERRGDVDGAASLLAWVASSTSTPNDMVDRITPRPLPEVAQRVKAVTGLDDEAPVMAEQFIQWVIEDHFINGRPAWEKAGVEMVELGAAVRGGEDPHPQLEPQLLRVGRNLVGLNFIHEGVANPAIRKMAFDYVTDDVIPSLETSSTRTRWTSPPTATSCSTASATRTCATRTNGSPPDGFAKIPGFLWPTFRECLARGASIAKTAKLPALFFEFLGRWHRGELPFEYQDRAWTRRARTRSSRAPIRWPRSSATRSCGGRSPATRASKRHSVSHMPMYCNS